MGGRTVLGTLLALIVSAFPGFTAAAPLSARINLAFSEFDEISLAADIHNLMQVLESTVQTRLEESPQIRLERITSDSRRSMTRAAWSLTSYQYLLTTELRSLPKDYLAVKVHLHAIRGGILQEVYSPPVLILPADLASYFLFPWFEHLSLKVRDAIEGTSAPLPFIYAYCFNVASDRLANLRAQLPFRLVDLLRSSELGRHYRIMGFRDLGEAGSVCEHWSKPSSLGLYDYVIAGDVALGIGSKDVIVDVAVWMGDRHVPIGSVSNDGSPTLLASKLAVLIIRNWSSIFRPEPRSAP